jgi:DNA-binding MarR family transcriptional regulator
MARARERAGAAAPRVGEGKRGPDGHIGYLLRQASAALRQALDAKFAALGLTHPQFLVLNVLAAYPGASGAEVARITMLTPQTINLIVRNLERGGLIGRRGHETHGRVLRADLTAAGKRALAQCKRRANAVEASLLEALDQATVSAIRQWLVQVALRLARE